MRRQRPQLSDVLRARWSQFSVCTLYYCILLIIYASQRQPQGFTSVYAMASNPYISGIKLPGNLVEDQTFFGEIKSVIGGRVALPCNLTLPSPDDAIQLIFWYRGNNSRVPIYTVDSRTASSLANATHFLSDIFSPKRAIFDLTLRPVATLQVDPVVESDHGDYRCRVDFRWGRTINSFVTLNIIVPPKRIAIRDQNGNFVHDSTIGPYDQNSDVKLTCEAVGGIPPPILQWYKDGVMVDGSYVVGKNGTVWNELTIYKLSAHDLKARFVCQAGNFNSSDSLKAYVTLDIILLPVTVQILNNRSALIAGHKVDIRCEANGSRPAANIRWFKGNVPMTHSTEIYENNKTESSITLMPSLLDNSIHLHCRASNSKRPEKYIEDVWPLQVFYKPQILLNIENSTKSTTVKEESQILIECQVSANPSLVDIRIVHESKTIYRQDQFDSSIANVTRIVLASVNYTHQGRYQCQATNEQGTTRSNEVQLNVHYLPFCVNGHWSNSSALKSAANQHSLVLNETVLLRCPVNANPTPSKYYWTLHEDNIDDNHLLVPASSSNELSYTVHSSQSYGKITCWAKNTVGMQRRGCFFVITKAGPPEPLMGCSVTNKTTTSLTVDCIPGDNGGSVQHFHAQVYEAGKEEAAIVGSDFDSGETLQAPLLNLTSASPTFYLRNLSPGTLYMVELYTSNARGQSEISRLSVTTLFTKNTKLISSSLQEVEYDHMYSAFFAALFGLVLIFTVTFASCRLRQRQINRQTKETEKQIKQNFAFSAANQNQSCSTDNNKSELSKSNSKLNLYVIKEIKSENNDHQMTNSVLIGDNESVYMPHVSALYPPTFRTIQTTECASSSTTTANELIQNNTVLAPACFLSSNFPQTPTSYFISPPNETILYASNANFQPHQIFNEKIDEIVLNDDHFGYYHSGNVPNALNETIVLHHHQPQSQSQLGPVLSASGLPQAGIPQESMCDLAVHQTTV